MKSTWVILLVAVSQPAVAQDWKAVSWEAVSYDHRPTAEILYVFRRPYYLRWGMGVHCRRTDGELEAIVLHSHLQARVNSSHVPGVMHKLWYQLDTPGGLDAVPFPEDANPQYIAVACVHGSRCIFAESTAWELIRPLATEDHEKLSFEILGLRFSISLKKARERLSELSCVRALIEAESARALGGPGAG